MCADMFELGASVKQMEKCGADYLHIDIMDGVFVPNYTLGTDYIKNLHSFTDIPLDIHLMISAPDTKLDRFDIRKNDAVSVHFESTEHIDVCLEYINSKGADAILAINPPTPVECVLSYLDKIKGVLVMTVHPGYAGQKLVEGSFDKIKKMRRLLDGAGYEDILIEVDGNVSFENAVLMKKAGADMFVSGSSGVFAKHMTFEQAYSKFKICVE